MIGATYQGQGWIRVHKWRVNVCCYRSMQYSRLYVCMISISGAVVAPQLAEKCQVFSMFSSVFQLK